ncbi:hypothetical protein NCPPB3923_23420, partial [Burkholderia glumae]
FHIHVECDDGHAETMRDILVEIAQRDGERVQTMLSAGEALVDARLAFFDAIEAGAARQRSVQARALETVQ